MIFYNMVGSGPSFSGKAKIICDRCRGVPVVIYSTISRADLEKKTRDLIDSQYEVVHDDMHVEHVHRDGGCKSSVVPPPPAEKVEGGQGQLQPEGAGLHDTGAMSLGKVLLVDGDNILKRCFFARRNESDVYGKGVGGCRGFVECVARLARRYKDRLVIVAWDGGSSPRRLDLLSTYRQRKADPEIVLQYENQKQRAMFLARQLGLISLRYDNVEADDVISWLSRLSHSSVIYSSDSDFFQLVRGFPPLGHTVHRPMPKQEKGFDCIVSTATFKEETGYELSSQYLLAKSLIGDASDGIKGVPGIGEKTAPKLLAHLTGLDWGPVPIEVVQEMRRRDARITKHWDSFLLSYKLINLWSDDYLDDAIRGRIRKDLEDDFDAPAVAHTVLLELGYDDDKANKLVDSF